MPTYNESEVLEQSVAKLFQAQPELDLIIIDDASPDGTGEIARRLAEVDKRVSVLHRAKKDGLGRAYAQGFGLALERGYQRIVQMDADGSHQASDLGKLLDSDHDLVIGSRWVSGGEVLNWPNHRLWISRAGNAYARFAIGSRVRDVTAGFRAYKAELIAKLPLSTIQAHGYGFQVEMTRYAMNQGATIAEVPISFIEREGGRSKMTAGIILEAFRLCTRWLVARIFRR